MCNEYLKGSEPQVSYFKDRICKVSFGKTLTVFLCARVFLFYHIRFSRVTAMMKNRLGYLK